MVDEDYKVTVPAGHSGPMRTWTCRNCGTTHRTLQKLKSYGVPTLRRRRRHKAPPKQLFAVDTYWQREISFLQCGVTGYSNHNPGQALCPGGVSQHRTSSVRFNSLGFQFHFSTSGFICCFALFVFWEGVRTWVWVSRKVRRTWKEFGERKNMIKNVF